MTNIHEHFIKQAEEKGIAQGLEKGITQGIEQGIGIGREEGINIGTFNTIIMLISKGFIDLNAGAEALNISIEELENKIKEHNQTQS